VSRRHLGETAVGIRSRRDLSRDPVGGGGRFLFLAPWRGHTLIGTAYRRLNRMPGRAELKENDLRDLLQDCNEACPALALSWSDVSFYHWGFLPLQAGGAGPGSPLADAPRIVDHAGEGLEGLVTAVGVKYTTARWVAEEALKLVFRRLERTAPECRTAQLPLWGGGGTPAAPAAEIGAEAARRLQEIYGSAAAEVARDYAREARWSSPIAEGCAVLTCEVLRAIREEMAMSLADVVFRRTDLGSAGEPPRAHLLAAAALMAAEMGWSRERVEQELEQVRRAYDPLPRGAEAA
jgi:glycerol-3-phosphate dehydrogenase